MNDIDRQLGYAERMYNFWFGHEKDRWLNKSKLSPQVIHLSMLLNVQACRLFHSAIEQCTRSEAFCSRILSRSLYETLVALFFILKPKLRIVVDPICSNGVQKRTSDGQLKWAAKAPPKRHSTTRKDWLHRDLRAMLFAAHSTLDDMVFTKRCKAAGLKRIGRSFKEKVDPALIAVVEKEIGQPWTHILLNPPHTYSGISLASLVGILHPALHRWYYSIYHFQSVAAHGVDAFRHATINSKGLLRPAYTSEEVEVSAAIECAVNLLLMELVIMSKYIGFGPDFAAAVETFTKEFHEIYG